jgi:hypothetical protein
MAQKSVRNIGVPSSAFANNDLVRRIALPPHSSQPETRCSEYTRVVARDRRHYSHLGSYLEQLHGEPR